VNLELADTDKWALDDECGAEDEDEDRDEDRQVTTASTAFVLMLDKPRVGDDLTHG
jgi:hypothetical protein